MWEYPHCADTERIVVRRKIYQAIRPVCLDYYNAGRLRKMVNMLEDLLGVDCMPTQYIRDVIIHYWGSRSYRFVWQIKDKIQELVPGYCDRFAALRVIARSLKKRETCRVCQRKRGKFKGLEDDYVYRESLNNKWEMMDGWGFVRFSGRKHSDICSFKCLTQFVDKYDDSLTQRYINRYGEDRLELRNAWTLLRKVRSTLRHGRDLSSG